MWNVGKRSTVRAVIQSWLLRILRGVWNTYVWRCVLLHTLRAAGIARALSCCPSRTASQACKVHGISHVQRRGVCHTRNRLGICQGNDVSRPLRSIMSARLAASKLGHALTFDDVFVSVFRHALYRVLDTASVWNQQLLVRREWTPGNEGRRSHPLRQLFAKTAARSGFGIACLIRTRSRKWSSWTRVISPSLPRSEGAGARDIGPRTPRHEDR